MLSTVSHLALDRKCLHLQPNRKPGPSRRITQASMPLILAVVVKDNRVVNVASEVAIQRGYPLYVYDVSPGSVPSLHLLDSLSSWLIHSALHSPCQQVVPLLPYLGWTLEKVSCLPDISSILYAEDTTAQNEIQALCLKENRGSVPRVQKVEDISNISKTKPLTSARVLGGWDATVPLQFKVVACGGTFDRLHAGHRLLLAAAAFITAECLFCGVTSEKLLINKKNAALLQSYNTRQQAAYDYMAAINPGIKVVMGPLTDPQTPPLAATDPRFEAIVVSNETIPGAEEINRVRGDLGFSPLRIIVVGLLPGQSEAKLSSTHLRELEACKNC